MTGRSNGTSFRREVLRRSVVLIETDASRRRALRRVLVLAGYDVRAFAHADRARGAMRHADVIVAAVRPGDSASRRLLGRPPLPENHDGVGLIRVRRCAIASDAIAAAELEAAFDRVFVAPIDVGALLRWLAQHALMHIAGSNRDWVDVTRALNAPRPNGDHPRMGPRRRALTHHT